MEMNFVTIYWIIRWKRVNNFPKFFLICYVLLIEISIVIYFSFSQKRSTLFPCWVYQRRFASVLSYKYLFFNLDFGIISLGRYLVTKNIWLSRSYFFFIEGNKFKASMAVLRTFSNSSSLLGKTSLYNLFIIGTQIYHCFIRKIIVRPIN